ncbi:MULTISPECIES: WcbI family polysaccharide biosynthesis putative acetyltransferase [unclassified Acidocella]|uniref:WcbI family polysaccharide biosynthesis putative acetyltransferase n=1 Tax=unclassified Acidocella TaxID=2648610 RepID=UPI001181AF4E|nr:MULTISPECIES: WcbI family polysaccharide biosynthesis putative acetyltransferase [unclassified Acidocella]WBO60419.1 WcbI family polysaccharide biosynthesis putative acetyltransferase [Acidocella sp. MX-AZ03]
MSRLALFANCQAWPLYLLLSSLTDLSEVYCLDINGYGSPEFRQAADKALAGSEDLTIVTHPLSDHFGEYATAQLRLNYRVLTTTNIYFNGLHPDITYVGGFQQRVPSPMGDYHSKIVLASFLHSLSEDECLAKFTTETYQRAGFFDTYHTACEELLARDEGIDIKFASQFIDKIPRQPALFSMNHVSISLLRDQAKEIAAAIGAKWMDFPIEYLLNPMSSGPWWPIYPEIAERHNLSYRTPFAFKLSDQEPLFSLEKFICQSYIGYRDFSGLHESPTALDLKSNFSHLLQY